MVFYTQDEHAIKEWTWLAKILTEHLPDVHLVLRDLMCVNVSTVHQRQPPETI